MSVLNSSRRARTGRGRPPAGVAEAAARAKRAQDHLARKRRQDRKRIERERGRAASSGSRARNRGVLTSILFAAAFVLGLVNAPLLSEVFLFRQVPLERIDVQGASALTPMDIAKGARVEVGRSLDTLDPIEIREAVVTEPWIESARVLRLPTGTLLISVVERHAVARWRAWESSEIELVDPRGERFAGRTGPGGPLPLVRGKLEKDHALPDSAVQILVEMRRYVSLTSDAENLTLNLPGHGGSDASADRDSGYVLQIGEDGPRALLGKRFLTQRIARLAALLEHEGSDFQDARWIDLRYADRAVLRNEPASG